MLKVTLINPNHFTRYPQPPMGLALLAAVLEKTGHQVKILDTTVLKLDAEAVVPLVGAPDIVGLTATTPAINSAVGIGRYLKKAYPDLPIILGGPHATLLPKETLAATPEIDVLVTGEGEDTIIELLRAYEDKSPLDNIPGIALRRDGDVVINPPRAASSDLDSLPYLAYHLLPWQKYRPHPPHGRALPFAAVITSRGCPYHCSYCSKPIFGSRYRQQSPPRVVDEIAYHSEKYGIREFAIYDDVFTLDKKRSHAIADEIMKRGLKIAWTCETRVNLVDKELLRHIKQAGCYSIAYGIESGSPAILNILDKGIGLEQVEEAVRWSREAGLQTIGYFMVGSPQETPQTIRQTIQFAKKLKLDFAQFAITIPFPGTRLYDLYRDSGKTESLPWESFIYAESGSRAAPVFESPLLSRDDIQGWARRAYREFYLRPSYLWQRLRHIVSIGDLKLNIKGLSMLLENIKPAQKGR
ncbi:MAG: radical SAM protein [Dehalococcoidales bacterium]|nr:radical SAM protein [Dehalococcoidales bacterium]MDZ4230534.1 radical SAM protein [Dehalococcoidales bacterium]